jgi:hypothetical protein
MPDVGCQMPVNNNGNGNKNGHGNNDGTLRRARGKTG